MGYSKFVYGTLHNIWRKRYYRGHLEYTTVDGVNIFFTNNFVMFLASNLSNITGNSFSSPKSVSDDRCIYLTYILAPISRCALLRIMLSFDSGKYINHPNVCYIACKKFLLQTENGLIVVDGEPITDRSVNVEINNTNILKVIGM